MPPHHIASHGLQGWLIDMAQDLDVLIAQRAFDDAADLIVKARKAIPGQMRVLPCHIMMSHTLM